MMYSLNKLGSPRCECSDCRPLDDGSKHLVKVDTLSLLETLCTKPRFQPRRLTRMPLGIVQGLKICEVVIASDFLSINKAGIKILGGYLQNVVIESYILLAEAA